MMKRINTLTQIILCAALLFLQFQSQAMDNEQQNIAGSIYKGITNSSAMGFNTIKNIVKVKILDPLLILAAFSGNTKTVGWLLKFGSNVGPQENTGRTALMAATWPGYTETMKTLINAGADVDAQNKEGWTALMGAAKRGLTKCLQILINARADLNAQDSITGRTALMWAADHDHTECVQILTNAGADPNIQNRHGDTILMLAAYYDNTDAAKVLIFNGANPTIRDNDGKTADDYTRNEHIREMLHNPQEYIRQHPKEFESIYHKDCKYKLDQLKKNQNIALTLRNREIGRR